MSIEPPSNPAYDEADRAAVRRHNVELLTKLNDAAAAWSMDLLQTRPPTPEAAEQTAATFDRVIRGVRRAVLLIDKLIEPDREPPAEPRPRRAPPPERPPRPKKLTAAERATRDRLDSLDHLDPLDPDEHMFDNWPDADLFLALCKVLSLEPTDDSGTPRTWDQITAIYFLREARKDREARQPPDTS